VAAKTNTELIQELFDEIRKLGERLAVDEKVTERELKQHAEELASLKAKIEKAAESGQEIVARTAALEQRCNQLDRFDPERVAALENQGRYLEKLVDEARTRRWQVWLALFGAILGMTTALVVAFVRRP
jgi:DNA repair exonuclease SbcCD ATPase subunit